MSWQWAGHKGGAWLRSVVSLSLSALTEPGWPSRVNLSLGLGNCAWKKAFQEEPDMGPTFYYTEPQSSLFM